VEAEEDDSVDGTDGLTKSGVIRLAADCSETEQTTIQGRTSSWLRGRLTKPLPPEPGLVLAQLDRLTIRTVIDRQLPETETMPENAGFPPDKAFANTLELDVSKAIYPFGQQPQPGSAFYLTSAEAFAKAGAEVTLHLTYVVPESDGSSNTTPLATPVVTWEYWNGRSWSALATVPETAVVGRFEATGSLTFTVPPDMTLTKVNNEEGFWIRARLKGGGYGIKRTLTFDGNTVVVTEIRPPVLGAVQMGYLYRSPQAQPTYCLTYSDFQWADQTESVRWRGAAFEPFSLVADRTPTLYLGFDRTLPADQLSLYLDVAEVAGQNSGPLLTWEYDDGSSWRSLTVSDETNNLALPGMVTAVYPGVSPLPSGEAVAASGNQVQLANARQAARFRAGDLIAIGDEDPPELMTVQSAADAKLTLTANLSQEYQRVPVSLAALPRFGKPRTWLRARLQTGGDPLLTQVNSLHFNAVWAAQIQTIENEVLGSSNGQAGQVFFSRRSPVLAGELLEVKELSGARAPVELAILKQELAEQGLGDEVITTVTDPRSGKISEVWVRWQEKPHLFFSRPDDRHYVIERSRGRIIFGDDQNGRIPTAARDNIRLRQYRSGGGAAGNVAAEAITQLLSGVPAAGVSNPVAAEGGADTEPVVNVQHRGPQVVRHQYQAISLSDYEALAREASPAVAVARALPTTHSSGRETPGWVKIIIMPHSQEPRPQPSFGLRRQVQAFLAARVPAAVAAQITVTGPTYLPVGVQAVVTPLNAGEAGVVRDAVIAALKNFLHPLTGGPEGAGWAFGRDVYLSDVAAVLEAVRGVDYVSTLNLLWKGSPSGERLEVPPDRIVVAGQLKIMLA
jgi:predicted phage baseplate assembly protein